MSIVEARRGAPRTLTARQTEDVAQLARGRTVTQIAADPGVSHQAVYKMLGRVRATGAELSEVGR